MKTSTINIKEIEKFSKMADEWWDPNGKFKPLHNFNPVRIDYIKRNVISHFKIKNSENPLYGKDILDIGCGGGLLSEPMSKLGGNVTGIDASEKNIIIADLHAKRSGLKIDYIASSPEKMNTNKKFDIILNMEIVEHVEDINFYIKKSSDLLKNSGIMFFATINRTLKSYVFAIVGAEYILRWLPIGTHQWEKFVKPSELIDKCNENFLKKKTLDGVSFNPLTSNWKISNDKSVNYIMSFEKN